VINEKHVKKPHCVVDLNHMKDVKNVVCPFDQTQECVELEVDDE